MKRLLAAVLAMSGLVVSSGVALGHLPLFYSPQYVQVEGGLRVRLTDLRAQTTHTLTRLDDLPLGMSWSPDGGALVFVMLRDNRYQYRLLDLVGTHERVLVDDLLNGLIPAWAPDGRRLAFVAPVGDVCVVALTDGPQGCLGLRHPAQQAAWAPLPGDTRLAVVSLLSDSAQIELLNLDGARLAEFGAGLMSHIQALIWSPDGQYLAFAGREAEAGFWAAYVVSLADGALHRISDPADAVFDLAWSPDGAWIALTMERDRQRLLYVMRPDGSGLRRVMQSPHGNSRPSWSPDGKSLLLTARATISTRAYIIPVTATTDVPLLPRTIGANLAYETLWRP